MMKAGLCSITFRERCPADVAALAQRAGLDAVEWGGDVHVPAGNLKAAESVRCITTDAGLETAAYGSYYGVIDSDGMPQPFEPVLETALALGTDMIRIWAGQVASGIADEGYRFRLIDGVRKCAHRAAVDGVRLGVEFHPDTLSDSSEAATALLDAISMPNVYSYWQPPYWVLEPQKGLGGPVRFADRVANMHVYNWQYVQVRVAHWKDYIERRPLAGARDEWIRFLSVPLNPAMEHYALLEYVRGDDPTQFMKDARTLKECLRISRQMQEECHACAI